MVIGADVLWVAASALTVRSGDLTPIGDTLAALVAALVTTWALLQLLGIRPWGNGRIALAGLGLAVIAWFLEAARAPGDIRPRVLRSGIPTSEAQRGGRERLAEAAARHGFECWKKHKALEFVGTDEWAGLGGSLSWWPHPKQAIKMISALGSFTSRVDLLDGPAAGEVWGIQSWRAYKIQPGDSRLKWVSNRAIEFYLPTLQYFAELPFRLLSATHVAYAGETGYRGRRYDVVFATWGAFTPNSKYDQYQVWISRDSGLMEIVHYTIREGAPSFAAGTMFYEDFRPVASMMIPFKQTVTATRPEQSRHPLDENFFHQLRLQSARMLDKEPESLYPDSSQAEQGDWKPER